MLITSDNQNNWIFGIPFLKKYLLTYDYDHKVIGFYKQSNKLFKNKDYKFNSIKIILFFIVVLIFGFAGFFISKYTFGYNRKKRLNELQENYEYNEKYIEKNKISSKDNLLKIEKEEKLIELEIENCK